MRVESACRSASLIASGAWASPSQSSATAAASRPRARTSDPSTMAARRLRVHQPGRRRPPPQRVVDMRGDGGAVLGPGEAMRQPIILERVRGRPIGRASISASTSIAAESRPPGVIAHRRCAGDFPADEGRHCERSEATQGRRGNSRAAGHPRHPDGVAFGTPRRARSRNRGSTSGHPAGRGVGVVRHGRGDVKGRAVGVAPG